eukprot:gi/632987522/ref/XP_007882605.1/ PREDICTED: arf-GAP with GTPase, ANK repeat and PH domain-containing protein 1-like isoform X2 [Callorhinchus milii]
MSDCSSSLPSTPNVVHRDLRADVSQGATTPGSVRKHSKRRASLFTGRRGSDSERRSLDSKTDNIGSGRAIPIKQGVLQKRSGNSLNKEWKKKYVTLCNNGILSYHPSLHDYMQNVHGKEMDLLRTTVKVPGKRPPRAVSACSASSGLNGLVSSGQDSVEGNGAGDGVSSPSSGRLELPASPQINRKKHRRKKSVSKADSMMGLAEGNPPSPAHWDPAL